MILVNGCTTLITKEPKLHDLQGKWESTGPISYYQLAISETEGSYLAVVYDQENIKTYKLEEFKTLEQYFTAKFIDTENDEKPVNIKGTLILGRLTLEGALDQNEKIWFLKAKDITSYRKLANDTIGSLNKLQHNN